MDPMDPMDMIGLPHALLTSEDFPSMETKAVLPAILASAISALCLAVAPFVRPAAMKIALDAIGLILVLIGACCLIADLCLLVLRFPPPSKVRTCVWALLPFGELLAGRSATLGTEVIGVPGLAVERCQSQENCPQPTFAHEPWLEQTTCPCCMQDFTRQTHVAIIRCGHIFCEPCLRAWAAASRPNGGACPVCRMSFELEET
mmetsp:Transcript_118030/g.296772  ORF Transcript_118030/g.296772 Transcript_118030/m.296772 type:complete len:203 (-) Transcript_118030:352-960(-)